MEGWTNTCMGNEEGDDMMAQLTNIIYIIGTRLSSFTVTAWWWGAPFSSLLTNSAGLSNQFISITTSVISNTVHKARVYAHSSILNVNQKRTLPCHGWHMQYVKHRVVYGNTCMYNCDKDRKVTYCGMLGRLPGTNLCWIDKFFQMVQIIRSPYYKCTLQCSQQLSGKENPHGHWWENLELSTQLQEFSSKQSNLFIRS